MYVCTSYQVGTTQLFFVCFFENIYYFSEVLHDIWDFWWCYTWMRFDDQSSQNWMTCNHITTIQDNMFACLFFDSRYFSRHDTLFQLFWKLFWVSSIPVPKQFSDTSTNRENNYRTRSIKDTRLVFLFFYWEGSLV